MCGIAGILSKSPADRGWVGARVESMTATLEHRGPDDRGTWIDEDAGIGLGFRRLSIIDLSQLGHQPMRSFSDRYVIVYNGEVFNHRALRRDLEGRGVRFRGHSDTEVILGCFETFGIADSISRFVGMFAIAVWDRHERSLHLIRDRLGIKPLHYFRAPGLFVFGSELRALAVVPEVPRQVDPVALLQYLRYLYVPAPRSILEGVHKLPPGHHLILRDPADPPTIEPFWSLREAAAAGRRNPVSGSEGEVVEEFEALLRQAVALRLESDVPLGALLSGGIDSSTVVALMQAASSRPVKTYSIAFPGTEHDEGPMAAAVAAHLGTDHRQLPVDANAALALATSLPELNDEPFADPSQIPTLLVSRLAREEVTVALTGDGGDELFGGYNRYLNGPGMIAFAQRVPRALRQTMGAAIGLVSEDSWERAYRASARLVPGLEPRRLAGEKARKLGDLLQADTETGMYRSLLSAWQNPERLFLSPPEDEDPYSRAFGLAAKTGASFLERAMLVDQMLYLPDDLLAKVDRMSMAVSLEARVPLLDHRIVEYSWRLRPEQKIRDGKGKWILRQVLSRMVPPHLMERPKVGFTVPIADWLAADLREWCEEHLSPARIRNEGFFDADQVMSSYRSFQNGKRGLALGLWAVVMFNAWLSRWGGAGH